MSEFSRHPTTAVSRDVVNGCHVSDVTTLFFVDLGLMVKGMYYGDVLSSPRNHVRCRPDHHSAGELAIHLLQRETSDLIATDLWMDMA